MKKIILSSVALLGVMSGSVYADQHGNNSSSDSHSSHHASQHHASHHHARPHHAAKGEVFTKGAVSMCCDRFMPFTGISGGWLYDKYDNYYDPQGNGEGHGHATGLDSRWGFRVESGFEYRIKNDVGFVMMIDGGSYGKHELSVVQTVTELGSPGSPGTPPDTSSEKVTYNVAGFSILTGVSFGVWDSVSLNIYSGMFFSVLMPMSKHAYERNEHLIFPAKIYFLGEDVDSTLDGISFYVPSLTQSLNLQPELRVEFAYSYGDLQVFLNVSHVFALQAGSDGNSLVSSGILGLLGNGVAPAMTNIFIGIRGYWNNFL